MEVKIVNEIASKGEACESAETIGGERNAGSVGASLADHHHREPRCALLSSSLALLDNQRLIPISSADENTLRIAAHAKMMSK